MSSAPSKIVCGECSEEIGLKEQGPAYAYGPHFPIDGPIYAEFAHFKCQKHRDLAEKAWRRLSTGRVKHEKTVVLN